MASSDSLVSYVPGVATKRFVHSDSDWSEDMYPSSAKRFAFENETDSDDESVNSYGNCPTDTIGSSSTDESEDSDEDSSDSEDSDESMSELDESCFADGSSENESEEEDDEGMLDNVFHAERKEFSCINCHKETQPDCNYCSDCWKKRKWKTGAPPRLKKLPGSDLAVSGPEMSDEERCVVCQVERKELTLVHGSTGHECVCYDCASRLDSKNNVKKRRCPMCRKIFTKVVRNLGRGAPIAS